jgi:DNA-binding XRE family transcriptional regulator
MRQSAAFSRELRAARGRRNETKVQAAKFFGVNRGTYRRWETPTLEEEVALPSLLSVAVLLQLAEYMEQPPSWVLQLFIPKEKE